MLIATTDQLTAAAALIELDGMARRIVLCPPDLPLEYLPAIVRSAAVNAIISDRLTTAEDIPGISLFHSSRWKDRSWRPWRHAS